MQPVAHSSEPSFFNKKPSHHSVMQQNNSSSLTIHHGGASLPTNHLNYRNSNGSTSYSSSSFKQNMKHHNYQSAGRSSTGNSNANYNRRYQSNTSFDNVPPQVGESPAKSTSPLTGGNGNGGGGSMPFGYNRKRRY
jgi:hypothetical protein